MPLDPIALPPFEEVLHDIAQLQEDAFGKLHAFVRGEGFEADTEQRDYLAQALSLSRERVFYVLSVLAFVYRQARADLQAPESIARRLGAVLQDDVAGRTRLISRLTQILAPNAKAEKEIKIGRLKSGFLKNATGFGSFLDLRPNFSEDLKEVHGLIPVIQFRIATDATDPADAAFVFQLDEEGLAKMKEAIERSEKKLKQLSALNISDLLVRKA
jgi:hypothetical protein